MGQLTQQRKDPLEDLTYVVLTYRRQSYALRFMNYWDGRGPRVIIIDGSGSSIPKEYLESLGASVTYIHNPVGIYARLQEALGHITTRYVALAGDDEFYIPSAVTSCLRELERDCSLVACCGRALGFSPSQNHTVSGFPQYPLLRNYSLCDEDPKVRLVKHLGEYVPGLIYAISRTDAWKTAWNHTLTEEFPAYSITELQFEMCMSVAGKSKVLPELMWLRSRGETEPTRGTDASNDPNKSFAGWWRNPANAGDKDRFLSLMSDAFADLLGQSGDRREWVVRAFETYLSCYPEQQRTLSLKQNAKNLVKRVLPSSYQKKIRGILKSLRSSRSQPAVSLVTAAEALQAEGVSVDFAELRNIEDTVVSFHRKAEGRSGLQVHAL